MPPDLRMTSLLWEPVPHVHTLWSPTIWAMAAGHSWGLQVGLPKDAHLEGKSRSLLHALYMVCSFRWLSPVSSHDSTFSSLRSEPKCHHPGLPHLKQLVCPPFLFLACVTAGAVLTW